MTVSWRRERAALIFWEDWRVISEIRAETLSAITRCSLRSRVVRRRPGGFADGCYAPALAARLACSSRRGSCLLGPVANLEFPAQLEVLLVRALYQGLLVAHFAGPLLLVVVKCRRRDANSAYLKGWAVP